jgi:large subunit ribosomal protein L15
MKLYNLPKIKKRKSKKIGRGYGSGKGGHTVGRGQKGQASRSGHKRLRSWIRESKVQSLPKLRGIGKRSSKRGYFKAKKKYIVLNLSDINEFPANSVIDLTFLKKKNIVKIRSKKVFVKILGNGKIDKKMTIKGLNVSENARKKIEKAGGSVN